ncbi:hypothetical protein KY284_020950 [Solanum tuberosum]|nr:hypothetical protein KY284_020950 [Solanum tuberosum]
MALINKGVKQMLRQRRQRPQQEFNNNEFKRNDDRCYYCGKLGHIKQNCQERKRRNNRRNDDPKNVEAWSQGETSEDDHDETANICFMALGETSKKIIDEYNKIAQEKKGWQILLEARQVEVDLLEENTEEEKMS